MKRQIPGYHRGYFVASNAGLEKIKIQKNVTSIELRRAKRCAKEKSCAVYKSQIACRKRFLLVPRSK